MIDKMDNRIFASDEIIDEIDNIKDKINEIIEALNT